MVHMDAFARMEKKMTQLMCNGKALPIFLLIDVDSYDRRTCSRVSKQKSGHIFLDHSLMNSCSSISSDGFHIDRGLADLMLFHEP